MYFNLFNMLIWVLFLFGASYSDFIPVSCWYLVILRLYYPAQIGRIFMCKLVE